MTFTKSLRWKLLAWYALVACVLAIVFGALLYRNVRRSTQREIDSQLQAQADAIAGVIIPVGDGKFQVELTAEQSAYFGNDGPGASHYAIWSARGASIDESHPTLSVPAPTVEGSRDRGPFRELSRRGPGDVWVLVGEDVRQRRSELRELGALAVGAGLAAMGVMAAGGWFLTGRALAPIHRISSDAAAISASNLSQRIDANRMELEFAGLAGTLNSALDRLQHAFEQQTRFTADASHELRTPLAVIVAQSDFALKQPRSADDYRETLEAIRRAAGRMNGVVEGLLTLARADGGEVRFNRQPFDLKQLVDETCRMLAPLAAREQILIEQRLEKAPVCGDRARLGEAIANILSNAVRYNAPGGRVDVTLNGSPSEVVLRVADTGRGIPAQIPRIFDRFYRVDASRARTVEGNGLGLAITSWIINAHDGTIECESVEQRGTVFTVRLARAELE